MKPPIARIKSLGKSTNKDMIEIIKVLRLENITLRKRIQEIQSIVGRSY